MSRILVGSDLNFNVNGPTTFLFQIAASQTAQQTIVNEQFTLHPYTPYAECQVGVEGNRLHRITAEVGQLSIQYRATVDLQQQCEPADQVPEADYANLPAEVLQYLNPSRYCESDLLSRFAFEEFGQMNRGYGRVQAICDWVHDHLDYTPGSTGPTTTAADVLLQRVGVCRDYSHLAITLCRGLGIPARYVSGYAVNLQPPDFHGFFEAFLDHNWYLFDATRLAPIGGLVRIGTGRDAADVALSTRTGNAVMTSMNVWANDAQPNDPAMQTDGRHTAVSTA
ncbi:MAG: transglutaminase-like domain-containing protein [Planctomycetaceae bacterium]